MLMKRRPPLVAVLALSVTALLGRTLWVAGPKLIDTFGAIPLVPAAAVGSNGDGGRLGDGAVPFRQPRPGVGPTLPRRLVRPAARVWDAAPQAPTSQRTLRRLAQSSREPNPPEADLAYFVQVSASNVALLPRLMAAIYHPDNAYAVHFDVKIGAAVVADTVDKVGSALAAFAAEGAPSGRRQRDGTKAQRTQVALPENVLFMDRTPVTYRGITTVLNTLEGMSTLLNYTRPVADGSSRTAADAERPPGPTLSTSPRPTTRYCRPQRRGGCSAARGGGAPGQLYYPPPAVAVGGGHPPPLPPVGRRLGGWGAWRHHRRATPARGGDSRRAHWCAAPAVGQGRRASVDCRRCAASAAGKRRRVDDCHAPICHLRHVFKRRAAGTGSHGQWPLLL
eukprot:TRINITY_DN2650_c0_g1_i5.p1 TRINITY_DN2650_c0_g1~~TRINITY_DN2650_c0_g1_i5.p1  ORF type:complete len:393 (-),score=61.90 TRINITY_DN2650_c0_g1_i5:535-1713(-)